MKHLILGCGPAGVSAAETLRQHAREDDILLLGDELERPYARAKLPQLIGGTLGESELHLARDEHHFSRLRIQRRLGRVRRIDPHAGVATLEDGCRLSFDRLLIATGARPVLPVISGIESSGVHACWSLQDARNILQRIRPQAHVVIVGAGQIGCLLMQALAERRVRLTVVEKGMRMLPNMLGEGAGRIMKRWCEARGIRVHTATKIRAITTARTADGKLFNLPLALWLSSGEVLRADVVICTTGSIPNTGFLQGSGIRCASGILVNDRMQTNFPHIYAAGDCAEVFDPGLGRTVLPTLESNAVEQGACAAMNMAGCTSIFRDIRQIDSLNTLGLPSAAFGMWRGVSGGQWVELSDERNFRYMRLEFRQDILVGSNLVGLPEEAALLRELIQRQVALGEWKDRLLKDPTLVGEAYQACIGHPEVH